MCKEREVIINLDDFPQFHDDIEHFDDREDDNDSEYEEIIFISRDNINYLLDQLGGFKIDEEEWRSFCWHQMGDMSALARQWIFTDLSDALVFDALFTTIIEKQLESHCE